MIRPLNEKDEYDLDNVCLLRALTKGDITQVELKRLYGEEIKAYAGAYNMLAPVEEHNRCWRLQYADEVSFHLDTLPCVPEDAEVVRSLVAFGVPPDWAGRAIAITDRKHPHYKHLSRAGRAVTPAGLLTGSSHGRPSGGPAACWRTGPRRNRGRPPVRMEDDAPAEYPNSQATPRRDVP